MTDEMTALEVLREPVDTGLPLLGVEHPAPVRHPLPRTFRRPLRGSDLNTGTWPVLFAEMVWNRGGEITDADRRSADTTCRRIIRAAARLNADPFGIPEVTDEPRNRAERRHGRTRDNAAAQHPEIDAAGTPAPLDPSSLTAAINAPPPITGAALSSFGHRCEEVINP